ncbi:hypothetical protein PZQ46_11005 [Aliarcobacter butzleri]
MGIEEYNQQNAISDDPYVLVLKLYEGVIKFLSFAECGVPVGDLGQWFG